MSNQLINFLLGAAGFAVYELLRLWKFTTDKDFAETIWRQKYGWLYVILIPFMAAASGLIAWVVNPDNYGTALYVGFGVPTGISYIKSIFEKKPAPTPTIAGAILTETILTAPEKPSKKPGIIRTALDHFSL